MTDKARFYRADRQGVRRPRHVHHSSANMSVAINHTNTAENFFCIFKRGVIGTYHHMSE